MKHEQIPVVASIDVGTNFLRMMIAQINSEQKIIPLEDLYKPTRIGRDTFSHGRIGVDSIYETCETLQGFARTMKDYRVKHYRAVATSGIREAQNCEYVLELIRLKTGLKINQINNAEERFFLYKALRNNLPDVLQMRQDGIIIVNIGMGGVETSVYTQGHLKFTEYVMVGSLRLREILADLERMTLDFPSILEEFTESKFDLLNEKINQLRIKHFVGLGGDLSTLSNLCVKKKLSRDGRFIEKSALQKLYSDVRSKTTEQLIQEYRLHRNEAEIVLPSLVILSYFLRLTEASGIYLPMVSLKHGLLEDLLDEWFDTPRRYDFMNDIISSVRFIGEKHHLDRVHSTQVERIALSIFDQTNRLHGLGDRERLYLQVASILHDIGKHINLNQHDLHSYEIIRSQDLMGFSTRELNLMANVARYHSEENPHPSHQNFQDMDERDRSTISKLVAILRLADALDVSHKQKVELVQASVSGRELHLRAQTRGDILLEEWNFASRTGLFEEVMGYQPVLKRKIKPLSRRP